MHDASSRPRCLQLAHQHRCFATGALHNNEKQTITSLGQVLAALPVDVSVGKMLVMGTIFGLTDVTLVLAAILSVQSPFKYVRGCY